MSGWYDVLSMDRRELSKSLRHIKKVEELKTGEEKNG